MYNFGQNKGVVEVGQNGVIDAFREKSDIDGDLINIGFMVFEAQLFDYIEGDGTVFEKGPLTALVKEKELAGYIHIGNAWIPSGKNNSLKNGGKAIRRPGNYGKTEEYTDGI